MKKIIATTKSGHVVDVRQSGHIITLHFGCVQVYHGNSLLDGLVYADQYINSIGLKEVDA